jgi:hypothetical protein
MTATLDYQQRPKKRRPRPLFIVAAVLVIAAGFVIARNVDVKAVIERAQLLRLQARCANAGMREGQVVYEEIRTDAPDVERADFVKITGASGTLLIAPLPACWNEFKSKVRFPWPRATVREPMLFLGTVSSPSGFKRIVAVTRNFGDGGPTCLGETLNFVMISPGTWDVDASVLNLGGRSVDYASSRRILSYCQRFRFFAGSTDASDPTHLVIPFEADDKRGAIDGWLRDDETFDFRVRQGVGFGP